MPALSIPDDSTWDYNHKDYTDPYADWVPESGFVGGGSCTNLNDQTCGVSCTQCNWQWSEDETRADPWNSDSGKCRCVEKKSFIWGERCSSPSEGLCGGKCKECFKATMVEDPTQTDCRCRNSEAQFYA